MFGFLNLAKEVNEQQRRVKEIFSQIAEPDGKGGYKARPGITSAQVALAKEKINKINKNYKDLNNSLQKLNTDLQEQEEDYNRLRNKFKNSDMAAIYSSKPMLKAIFNL